MGPLPWPIGEFIDQEFELARAAFPQKRSILPDFRAQAEAFFRSTVLRLEQESKNGQE
jgi:hypothetical protein